MKMNASFNRLSILFETMVLRITSFFTAFVGGTVSYSQDGEDLILFNMLKRKSNGFYVDVGAHDPVRFSNTKFFYDRNWHGINIDPLPGMKTIFERKRPRDNSLEMGISNKQRKLKYYMFNEPALNGFSKEVSLDRINSKEYEMVSMIDLAEDTLANVLDRHLKDNQIIDFFSIDTEGFEMNVLKSNDWEKYRPVVILVEILNSRIKDIVENPIYKYLVSKGYDFEAKTNNTCFFRRQYD